VRGVDVLIDNRVSCFSSKRRPIVSFGDARGIILHVDRIRDEHARSNGAIGCGRMLERAKVPRSPRSVAYTRNATVS